MLHTCPKAAGSSIPAGLAAAQNHSRGLEVLEKPSKQCRQDSAPMGSSTGPRATSSASRVLGAGPRGVIKTFRLLFLSGVAWGRVGKEGEGRIQPRSPHQAGWLQTWSCGRYRARQEMSEGDVMENIYPVRSVHPWLFFGRDFEHRRADVSRRHFSCWKDEKHTRKVLCRRESK